VDHRSILKTELTQGVKAAVSKFKYGEWLPKADTLHPDHTFAVSYGLSAYDCFLVFLSIVVVFIVL
jgi:hypothetical protein